MPRARGCPREAKTTREAHSGQASGRTSGPMERGACTGAGLLAGLLTSRGPRLQQSVPEEWHPKQGTNTGAVHEEVLPMGRTHTEEIQEGLSSMGGTPQWSKGGA